MDEERILVLACSKKYGARCIAGISLLTGRWVRPVSPRDGGALTLYEAGVEGRFPKLRDVVTFEAERLCPQPGQPENVLVADRDWVLEQHLTPHEAAAIVDKHLVPGPEILGSLGRTTTTQQVALAPEAPSLAVVEPEDVTFELESVPWGSGSRAWARFELAGFQHAITLTELVVAPRLRKQSFGTYDLIELGVNPPPRLAMTVSLGEALNGEHYKLIAGIFGLA